MALQTDPTRTTGGPADEANDRGVAAKALLALPLGDKQDVATQAVNSLPPALHQMAAQNVVGAMPDEAKQDLLASVAERLPIEQRQATAQSVVDSLPAQQQQQVAESVLGPPDFKTRQFLWFVVVGTLAAAVFVFGVLASILVLQGKGAEAPLALATTALGGVVGLVATSPGGQRKGS
jgi:hypothetical protein